MNKFSIGDKVRFRQDGEIGILNQSMGFNLHEDHTVTGLSCRGEHSLYNLSCGINIRLCFVPEVQLEPVPEPKPKFANIKVGDWVEIRIPVEGRGSSFAHCQVIQSGCTIVVIYDSNETYFNINGFELCTGDDNDLEITRILSPKEVVVDFGSGIKGTIRKSFVIGWIYIFDTNGNHICHLKISALATQTRSIVESLIKAQEEK